MFLKRSTHWILFSVGLVLLFQNCQQSELGIAENGSFSSEGFSSQEPEELDSELIDPPESHPPTKKAVKQNALVRPLVGNRLYVYNLLHSVFGPTAKNFLVQQIAWSPNEFGMSNSLYNRSWDKDCAQKRDPLKRCDYGGLIHDAGNRKGFNTRRAGLRLRVCNYGIKSDGALLHALRKIDKSSGLESPPAVTDENLYRLLELFYRGKEIRPELVDALRSVYEESEESLEGWKYSIRAVCMSPHWQVI